VLGPPESGVPKGKPRGTLAGAAMLLAGLEMAVLVGRKASNRRLCGVAYCNSDKAEIHRLPAFRTSLKSGLPAPSWTETVAARHPDFADIWATSADRMRQMFSMFIKQ
jgi:hypothetical protein